MDQWMDQFEYEVAAWSGLVTIPGTVGHLQGRMAPVSGANRDCDPWVAGYKWIWTDKRWCKGRIDPMVEIQYTAGYRSNRL